MLSAALALVATVAGVATFLIPNLLHGPAVMNGSARGTALVMVALAVPALLIAMFAASRGSLRAVIVWLGSAAYLLYNSLVLLVLTPANQLFLPYIAMLSLSLWSIAAVLAHLDVDALRDRFSVRLPARGIAVYTIVIALLNASIWLRGIIPTIFASGSPAFLNGTGVATNIVYIQDLGIWLPLTVAAAVWLYRRKPWGYLVVGSVLTMWVIESIGIAVDQCSATMPTRHQRSRRRPSHRSSPHWLCRAHPSVFLLPQPRLTRYGSPEMVILIGGGSSVGKTTAAVELARRHGLQHLQVDAVRALEPNAAVNFVGSSPEVWDLGPEILRNRLIEMGALLRPHILRLVSQQLASGVPSVIEGEGIEPSLVESLTDGRVRLVFVREVDEERLAETLANRPSAAAARFRQLSAAQRQCVCRMNRLYGEWIEAEARSHGLPCLPSQPWGDLADRIFDAVTRPIALSSRGRG